MRMSSMAPESGKAETPMEDNPALLERGVDESELAYHKRLIYGKLVDKTLADFDYTEIAQRAYGEEYSGDFARRLMYGSCRTLQLMDKEAEEREAEEASADGDGGLFMSELQARKNDIQRERQRLFDQRREYNKQLSYEGRWDHLAEVLKNSVERLGDTVGSVFSDAYIPELTFSDNEAIAVFSDWHYGMICENVFNTYNTDICRRRVAAATERMIQRILLHKCRKLHVVVLGDLIHGAIHVSARVASEELVCDQIMQASELLAQSILLMSKYVDETMVYVTYGNHGRTVANKKDNIHRDNFERLVPWWLKQRFAADDSITVMDDDGNEFLFVNACGHQFCASHGDLDSVRTSPRLLHTLFQKKYGMDLEYILLGDKHHRESFEEMGITSMLCGALCGADDFANSGRMYSTPSQLLLIVTPEDGVDAEYRVSAI